MGAVMIRRLPAALALFVLSPAWGQRDPLPATRGELIQQQRNILYTRPAPLEQGRIERFLGTAQNQTLAQYFTTGWHGFAPAVGGMIAGSGFAGGVQYFRPNLFNNTTNIRSSARWSTNGYQLYDFELSMPELANGKAYLDFYSRFRDYTKVDYYGPGPQSDINGRSNYQLQDWQLDLGVGVLPFDWLRLGVTGGYYHPEIGPGQSGSVIPTQAIYTPAQAPGLDVQTEYFRFGPLAQIDYRDNPVFPRSGGQYLATFQYFHDRHGLGFTFRRLTAELQQFIPLFNKKRVIALRALGLWSFENTNQQVPFYLQPSVGVPDLRGFRPFRFYDLNSLVYNVEWRWEIMSNVEGALFYDAGKVFPSPGMLSFRGLQQSFGGGLRVRLTDSGAMIMRLDAGVSDEGYQIRLSFSDLFTTPQVRTGRQLSPPPGRLP